MRNEPRRHVPSDDLRSSRAIPKLPASLTLVRGVLAYATGGRSPPPTRCFKPCERRHSRSRRCVDLIPTRANESHDTRID